MIPTQRLLLRPWRDPDRAPFAALNADPVVTRYLAGPLDRAGSDAWIDRAEQRRAEDGFGIWAVEAPGIAPFIGAVGLTRVRFAAPFTPAVEVLWRLAQPFWRQGYATEAARAAIQDGFDRGLDEVVAFAIAGNAASIQVMHRLGMRRGEDFDHPGTPPGQPNRACVLYRLRCPA